MAHDTMSGGECQHQQSGARVMTICVECGQAFAAQRRGMKYCGAGCQRRAKICSQSKQRKAELRAMKREQARRRAEFLGARDAEYAAHKRWGKPDEVKVFGGLRVVTRGRVCGSPVGLFRAPAPVPAIYAPNPTASYVKPTDGGAVKWSPGVEP